MLWWPVLGAMLLWLPSPGYLITPKPCSVNGIGGTCMFVWECIKSEGRHLGMCVDTFMFGSCCAHDQQDNLVQQESAPQPTSTNTNNQPAILYTHHGRPAPQRPITSRPSSTPAKPITIYRPQSTQPPRYTQPASQDRVSISSHHEKKPSTIGGNSIGNVPSPNSIPSGGKPNQLAHVAAAQWHPTTEPGFVTRLKNKPTSGKPKPKPTKKPWNSTTQRGNSKLTTTTKKPISTTTTVASPSEPSVSTDSPLPLDMLPTSTFSSVSVNNQNGAGCGQPQLFPQPQTRIVGGRNAPFGRWPWQVSVRRTSFFGFSSTHRCGGAVLNENWIATAGHCVDDLLTSQIRIRVGEYDFSTVQEELPYVERGVAKKLVHPKYNFFTYEYDLALVKLDKPLDFAPHISPICLPASDDLLIGENATVTGWGRLSEKGTLPSVLQEVSVPIVSNDRCKNMFLRAGRHEFIPEIFLCAGHEGGGRDSCQGDSGGPLQVRGKDGRYFLAGIISWGIGCAEANLPGVCTRVSKFVPWILKHVT